MTDTTRAYDYMAEHEPETVSQAKRLFGDNWSNGARVATFDYFNRNREYEDAIKIAIIKQAEKKGTMIRPQDVTIIVERKETIDRYGARHRIRIYKYRVRGEFQERYTGQLTSRRMKI